MTKNKELKKWLECCTCGEKITADNFWTHEHSGYIDKSNCSRAKGKPMKK